MKKFLTQKINFAYAVIVMLSLTIGVTVVSAGYALPGESGDIDPLIHRGGGEQVIGSLRLGPCSGGTCSSIGDFDARGAAGSVSVFDTFADANRFYVLSTINVLQQVFIGADQGSSQSYWSGTYNGIPLSGQLQSVNVRGDVRATNLAGTSGETSLCFTPSGNLVKCI